MKKIFCNICMAVLLMLTAACSTARTVTGKKIGRLKFADISAGPSASFGSMKTFCCLMPEKNSELASIARRALSAQGFRSVEKGNAEMLVSVQASCGTARRVHSVVTVVVTKNDRSGTVLWKGSASCTASAAYDPTCFYPDLCRAAVQFAGRQFTGRFSSNYLRPLPAE